MNELLQPVVLIGILTVLDYLNAGGSPKVLQNHLSLDSRFWAEKDLTGDDVPEILVSIIGLNVFMCEAGRYTNILNLPLGGDPMALTLLAIQDMNLDGIPDLVLQDEVFSAGMRMYKIYEWNGKELQNLVWPETELSAWFLTPRGQGLNWYGYWTPDYLSPFNEDEYDNLAAYAQYRIMPLQVLQGDLVSARNTYETLQKKFQDSTQGYRFTQMATDFWQEYQLSKDLGKACLTVIKYAEEKKNDIFT